MEENREIEDQLKNWADRRWNADRTKQALKAPIMGARLSSRLSILFALMPVLFLLGVLFRHYLMVDLGPLTDLYDWIGKMDRRYGDESVVNWVIRFLLLGGPLVILVLNLLSVLHVALEKGRKELILTLRWRWENWAWIIAALLVFLLFAGYLIAENVVAASG